MREKPSNHPTYSGVCPRCGVEFTRKQGRPPKYCSKDCQNAAWRENVQRSASAKGNAKLLDLRDQGRDPRATEQATIKRRMAFRNSALALAEPKGGDDDRAWAERAEYWRDLADPPEGLPSLWDRRERRPLVLAGHGVRLRIRHGALEITHGLTHHPQPRRVQLLFPGDRRMPSRIVLVDASGAVTFDVIEFLARHDIALVMLDYRGRLISSLGARPGTSDVKLHQSQLDAIHDGRGLLFATELIRAKLRASLVTLDGLELTDRVRGGQRRVETALSRLDVPPSDLDQLRMIEAQAAASYFAGWLDAPLRWKGTGRRSVPPEWRRMPLRSSLLSTGNRNASHPINALLNYAYSVLEAQVRQASFVTGLDLAVGYLHVPGPRRLALVYDLMEPFRPLCDRAMLGFARHHIFAPADVYLTERGFCRLHPQLARVAASLAPSERDVHEGMRGCLSPLLNGSRSKEKMRPVGSLGTLSSSILDPSP